ncbi:transglutaminase family protein [Devosia riboflavina]|uniref:transglutaminase family protein n=1 Tax=Devosia riboflavina TaxID=46914 RepID=UPI000689AF63|nr:transglutaminase family protein [Devosia riboflavina]
MRIAIDHRLSVTVPQGTVQAVFHLLLTPPSGPTQTVESWSVEGTGIGNAGRFTDGFGNAAHLVNQLRPEGEITIHVRGEVTTRDTHGVLGRPAGEPVPALYRRLTELTKAPEALYEPFRDSRDNRLSICHALMARVGDVLGLPEEPEAPKQMQADGGQAQVQEAGEVAERPAAADYAHLFIGAARALDIPARYVVGYRLVDGEDGLHAWAEAFDEGLGWIGFDPHMQICPTDRYVRLAIGLDAEAAPTLRTVPVAEVVQVAKVAAA